MDAEGQKLDNVVGPIEEHSDLHLACEAEGGKPFVDCHKYLE